MTDTENPDLENPDLANAAPEDSALRPAESDLHAVDSTDDLTANTPGGAAESSDAADPADALPGDSHPGDGAVEHDPPNQPDAMRTAEQGREAAAARADTTDDKPTPTATPAD
jgi:hypothetical protein